MVLRLTLCPTKKCADGPLLHDCRHDFADDDGGFVGCGVADEIDVDIFVSYSSAYTADDQCHRSS